MGEPRAPERARPRRRGQPLVFLVTVLGVWSAARVAYHWPQAGPPPIERGPLASAARPSAPVVPVAALQPGSRRSVMGATVSRAPARALRAEPNPLALAAAMAHQRLWMESLVAVPGDGGRQASPVAPLFDTPIVPQAESSDAAGPNLAVPVARPGAGRWSVHGWSLVRQGNSAPGLAPAAQYGGSQAGLIVQYALAGTAHRPVLYARATSALARSDDRTLAMGISARPIAGWPVDLAVERRMALGTRQRDRFALLAVAAGAAGLGRSGVRIEAYGQAGLAGLSEPLGFFDLQLLATRPVHRRDSAVLALGGGLWAGGQQNPDGAGRKPWSHRVDIGPRAALMVPVERGTLGFALDWRQRVEGDARPGSGAALTLSAGF